MAMVVWAGTEREKNGEQSSASREFSREESGTVARNRVRPTREFQGQLLHGITVLAVDDHADSRELTEHVLARHGATVVVAGSAEEALELVERALPDVLVTDLAMPGEDGYWLLRQVRTRAAREGRPVAAIAVTAFTAAHSAERALGAGFDAYLPKPFVADDLCLAVAAVLGR